MATLSLKIPFDTWKTWPVKASILCLPKHMLQQPLMWDTINANRIRSFWGPTDKPMADLSRNNRKLGLNLISLNSNKVFIFYAALGPNIGKTVTWTLLDKKSVQQHTKNLATSFRTFHTSTTEFTECSNSSFDKRFLSCDLQRKCFAFARGLVSSDRDHSNSYILAPGTANCVVWCLQRQAQRDKTSCDNPFNFHNLIEKALWPHNTGQFSSGQETWRERLTSQFCSGPFTCAPMQGRPMFARTLINGCMNLAMPVVVFMQQTCACFCDVFSK